MLTRVAVLLLPLLVGGCSEDSRQIDPEPSSINQYLNITISVTSDDLHAANRAPAGGENGDGRETCFDRENAVTGITLILADGPLSSSTAKIVFVRYFPVTVTTGTYETDGHGHTNDDIEKKYTTGNQLVSRTELDMTEDKTYNVYVVANRRIDTSKGDDLSTIKDQLLNLNELFIGDGYTPDDCTNFVMASEQDVQVNFGTSTGVTKTEETNAVKFSVTPIIIERLAARIDFCTAYDSNTKNAVYGAYSVSVGGTPTTVNGFKYESGSGGGYFILESITPFNIYNEQQYLFERVTTGWTGTPAYTYLGQETAANYVVDPRTADKESASLNYLSPLGVSMATTWQRTAESLNAQTSKTTDNFVLAYCMENTLKPASPLKTYATGLVITGSYYDSDNKFLIRKSFYGYLRHQGETPGTTYPATELTSANLTADSYTGHASTAMNFSIVRNNIYRVNINTVGGWITLKVAEHDWRMVSHPQITM